MFVVAVPFMRSISAAASTLLRLRVGDFVCDGWLHKLIKTATPVRLCAEDSPLIDHVAASCCMVPLCLNMPGFSFEVRKNVPFSPAT